MAENAFQTVNLAAIADAIREKDGTTDPILPIDFPDRIRALPVEDSSDATATSEDILFPKTAYVDGEKVVGSIIPIEQSTPEISVNPNGLITADCIQPHSGYIVAGTRTATKQLDTAAQSEPEISVDNNGLITATVTQENAGFVPSGTKIATQQLDTVGSSIITPTTSEQIAVSLGLYTTGIIKVAGDSNLVPSNIKSGTSIFGVSGSYTGSDTGSGSGDTGSGGTGGTLLDIANGGIGYTQVECQVSSNSISFSIPTTMYDVFYSTTKLSAELGDIVAVSWTTSFRDDNKPTVVGKPLLVSFVCLFPFSNYPVEFVTVSEKSDITVFNSLMLTSASFSENPFLLTISKSSRQLTFSGGYTFDTSNAGSQYVRIFAPAIKEDN